MGVDMTRDFNSVFYAVPLLENVVHAGSASEADGTAKLVWGCRGGAAIVTIGNVDTATCVISLTFQKSPDNSSWTDIVPIGYSSADIEITATAGLGEDNIVAFSLDELFEGGYVRVQWQVTNGKNATAFGVNFVGFRGTYQPVFKKWAIGEIYAVDDVIQNDSFYFKCILAFGRALAEAEVIAGTSVSEPGVGTSTGTYWEIYKGAAL